MILETNAESTSPDGDRPPIVRFAPWIGARYDEGAVEGLRFLVLGESHYGTLDTPERERSLTTRVVEDYLSGNRRHRFVRSVTNVVLGPNSSDIELETLWKSSAFYNYVQEYAGVGAGKRPALDAWRRSEPQFRSVLARLRPHFILVCGRALWENLKQADGLTSEPVQNSEDSRERSRLFHLEDHVAVGGMIYHPASRGFRAPEWHPRVRRYIERAHAVKEGRLDA